jgi:hypothetical protein
MPVGIKFNYSKDAPTVLSIIAEFEKGLSAKDNADFHHVSTATVYRVLKENGMGTTREKREESRLKGIKKKQAQGYNPPPKYAWHLTYAKGKK